MKTYKELAELRTKEKDKALFAAIGCGYINQAILFNAGFSFNEVQKIKKVFSTITGRNSDLQTANK